VAVTITGPQPLPMAAQLGPLVAGVLADPHRERGMEFRLGTATTELVSDGDRVTGALASGEVLPADVVVVALGAVPDVAWLDGSGLRLADGVVCDAYCRAAPGVYAVGDVARFHHVGLGREIRLENRTNASEQAGVVAANVLNGADGEKVYAPIPYLWTEQYDAKIQVHGLPGGDAVDTVVEGDLDRHRFVVAHHRDSELVGVVGWGIPKQTLRLRQELAPAFTAAPAATAFSS
jgi:NADPH-dependent 2,4-dienoyl-CoA reductase/sulfur reductase-like enzyme